MIIDFKKYSSVKIGPKLQIKILDKKCDFDGIVVGGANNLLIGNTSKNLAILDQKFNFINILEKNENYMVLDIGCATKSSTIYKFAKENDLKGFEFLIKIPGLLGGLLKMNAGLKDECISNNLLSVELANQTLNKENINFDYRYNPLQEIMFSAKFKLYYGFDHKKNEILKNARNNQPSGASFGSIFKNPKGDFAARLIEAVGLKGYNKNDALISDKHANFLINKKNASFEDAIFLINLAQKRVFEEFGIKLQTEVKIIN